MPLHSIPPEPERLKLLAALLKTKYFQGGVWVVGQFVKAARERFAEPQYVSWVEIRRIVDGEPRRKPVRPWNGKADGFTLEASPSIQKRLGRRL